jgi:hypothetical protein
VITGSDVFEGATGVVVTGCVAADWALELPLRFLAMTKTRIVKPTSLAWSA